MWIRLLIVGMKAHSDRTAGKLPSPVWIQGSFRQDKRKIAFTCLNTRLIQTSKAGNCLHLSEYRANSDKPSRKLPYPVRIQGLFGQDKRSIAFTCPNTRLIQTGQEEYCFHLPEYKAHSDRTRGILLSPVWIQGSFRQDNRNIAFACPNTRLIQTGQEENCHHLSEWRD